MSKKAKPRDLQKLKRRSSLSRPTIHILCEGEKTEINYFEGLKKSLAISLRNFLDIQIISSKGEPCPDKMLAKAEKLEPEKGDEVWLVFDTEKESLDKSRMEKAEKVFKKCNNNTTYFSAISNPCFEVWFLLQFEEVDKNLTIDQILQKIKKHRKNYSKSKGLEFDESLAKIAIKNSHKRFKSASENSFPKHTSTRVHLLVEKILSIKSSEFTCSR
ncbi:MAG: RloB family protein [Bdellovibrionota bacterium]